MQFISTRTKFTYRYKTNCTSTFDLFPFIQISYGQSSTVAVGYRVKCFSTNRVKGKGVGEREVGDDLCPIYTLIAVGNVQEEILFMMVLKQKKTEVIEKMLIVQIIRCKQVIRGGFQ